MAGHNIRDISSAKIAVGGAVKNVSGMYLNGRQVWPMGFTYVITSAAVRYLQSSIHEGTMDRIDARGSNSATIVGTVQKKRGDAVIETLTDVTLTPIIASEFFYLQGKTIRGYDLQTESVPTGHAAQIAVKYVAGGVESEPVYKWIYQEANEIVSYVDEITSIGLSVNVENNQFPILGGSGALSAVKNYNRINTWTSEHTSAEAKQEDISTNISYVISGGGASIQSRVNVVVNSREHITTAGAWQITGRHVVDGVTYPGYLNITQTADAIISTEIVNRNARVGMSVSGSSIGATGGSCTLVWSGQYDSDVTNYWLSRPTVPVTTSYTDLEIPENDMWITGSASYYQRNGASVSHENMVRRTSDSVTYTVYGRVEGLDDVSYPVTITARNSRTKTRTTEVYLGLSVSASSSTIGIAGGTVLLTTTESYKLQYDYTWDSGYTDTEYSAETSRSVEATYSAAPSSEYSISGNEFTANSRIHNTTAGGPWTINALHNKHNATTTISQTADSVTDTQYTYTDYTVSISAGKTTFAATEDSTTLSYSGSHKKNTIRTWTSGGTTTTTETVTDIPTISASGDTIHYTLSENTVSHGNMARRAATDSVTYTAANNNQTASVTITATNNRIQTSQQEVTTSFSIDASTKAFPKEGGTALLSGYQHWKMQYNYTWDSGAIDTEYSGENLRSVETTFDIAPSSEYSLSGNELTVYANTSTTAKSWTLSGLWVGHYMGATLTIAQEAESVMLSYIIVNRGSSLSGKVGQSKGIVVEAVYSDLSRIDISAQCTYQSSNTSVMTCSAGVVTFVGTGNATLTAYYGGKNDSITIYSESAKETITITAGVSEGIFGMEYWAKASSPVYSNLTLEVIVTDDVWPIGIRYIKEATIMAGYTDAVFTPPIIKDAMSARVQSVTPSSDDYANYVISL